MLRITHPTLLINKQICQSNIRKMATKATASEVIFRPHFKTHQSVEVGEWFREEGVNAITVSSVRMAAYFQSAGWNDITIAFPVNILEIREINRLATHSKLNLLIESEYVADFLSETLLSKVGVFIKIDTGYHRCGIPSGEAARIDNLVKRIAESDKLKFRGFLTHSGQTYHAKSVEEVREIRDDAGKQLQTLKKIYLNEYPDIIISVGDTPGCSLPGKIPFADEIRPGNFAYYDLMQSYLNSCTLKDIAVAVACPLVAVHPERKEAIIYGGAVHLSKENCRRENGELTFGMAVRLEEGKWDTSVVIGHLKSISQEHGILEMQEGVKLKPGDLIAIIPVHSCLSADLLRENKLEI
ncbi:MAG: alanine racemase [Bacteroidales bacterium]|nr:alanine racemase [Bacteroidales bacterium]